MAYPSFEQYNEALQAPHLYLLDPLLKAGKVRTTGLGMPMAMCGGFALTYSLEAGGKRYALRCFHKEAPELERRYQIISQRLNRLSSPYFLPFEFNPSGIRINGQTYPIVKMAWASGETLSEFLEREHGNASSIHRLRAALAKLCEFLESERIAHGDIQPGNVMVSQNGGAVQLIDYDGLFVEALRGRQAAELGQLNFQHPQRSANNFDERLDRFSFIALDVALQALATDPGIWRRTHCDPDAVVFRRSDFLAPGVSPVFKDVMKLPAVESAAKNLAQIASAPIDQVPRLAEFLQQRNIPISRVSFANTAQAVRAAYQSAYPVLEGTNYASFLAAVGNKVELVGRIHSVVQKQAKNGKPYVFVNFSNWLGTAIKLTIWSEGLKVLRNETPTVSWIGRWIAVSGLVEPPFKKNGYTHISINVTQRGQIQLLTEEEAQYRLGKKTLSGGQTNKREETTLRNAEILRNMESKPQPHRQPPLVAKPVAASSLGTTPKSGNQQVLEQMRQRAQTPVTRTTQTPVTHTAKRPSTTPPMPQPTKNRSSGAWILILISIVVLIALMGG
ncbi:protein kinase family protein [Azotobacter bryophylli]|uniref:Protein kinase family protein n=1 Tax=Azotobacter bryophylli TaxID=1986537 RepID=A0ABV7B1B6_9GAMM